MSVYAEIRAFLRQDFQRFEEELERLLAAQHDYLSETERQLYRSGKRLRPILLFLSARLNLRCEPQPRLSDRVVTAGVSLEMLHVASLIHDDIIDVASLRRGAPTINSLRGSEMALLIGDLQFIEAARTFVSFADARNDIELLKRYLDAAYSLCRGQIDELVAEPCFSGPALLKRYVRTIDRKTGRLVAFACEGGARLAQATVANTSSLNRFGIHFGRAFQMMDDVLDFLQGGEEWGKRRFQDLAQRRLSLPVVLELARSAPDSPLRRLYRGEQLEPAQIERLGAELAVSNGLLEAYSQARVQAEEAKEALHFLPECEAKRLLLRLVAHVVDQGFLDGGSKRREWVPGTVH